MTYAIAHIVYGIDLQYSKIEGIDNLIEMDIVSRLYSGNGDWPVFFGIAYEEFDEAGTIDGRDLIQKLTATDEIIEEYTKRLANLSTYLSDGTISSATLDAITAIEPRVFVTWGTS